MITKNLLLAIILFIFCSCSDKNFADEAVINGNIGNNKEGEIYLINVAKSDIIKDSAKVINGKFIFKYKVDSSFSPFEARLCMWDNYKGIKYLRPIGFFNPYYKNYVESIFYVDEGITSIYIKTEKSNFFCYEVEGSRQNEPYYKHIEFDDLRNEQSIAERKKILADDLNKIASYPYSYDLLHLLYTNRGQYTNNELKLLMQGFSDHAKASLMFHKLIIWLAYKEKDYTRLSDPIIENENKSKEAVFDSAAKINMLVFWASWCAPCRKEIPQLKEIYLNYHTKGLSMTSISIDNNERNWQNALSIEKMPWKQLIANDSTKQEFDLEYDISVIPVIVLIDQKRQIIKRFNGYDENEFVTINNFINQLK